MNTGERKNGEDSRRCPRRSSVEIASKGGRAAHVEGTAHEWTADEARNAGRKGGQVSRGGRGRLIDALGRADATESGDGYGRRRIRRSFHRWQVNPVIDEESEPLDRRTTTLWRRPTMARRVAVAWALALAVAASASAQSNGSSATSTGQSSTATQTTSSSTTTAGHATGDDDVLRRHWAVVCADRRNPAEREVQR